MSGSETIYYEQNQNFSPLINLPLNSYCFNMFLKISEVLFYSYCTIFHSTLPHFNNHLSHTPILFDCNQHLV